MIDYDALTILSQMAVTSEYFLQATIDKQGKVIASDSGIGPIPTLFDENETPLTFAECFLASDWSKYENQRIKAWRNSQQSFHVELQKVVYPEGDTIPSRWEFFFLTKEVGTCLGIGHPILDKKPYDMQFGDYFDSSGQDNSEVLNSLLEDRLLGFWEFDYHKSINSMSQGLAQMLGYKSDELKSANVTWAKHIHPDDSAPLMRRITGHFKTTGTSPFKAEFRMISKGNHLRWVYCFGKTIEWDESGHPSKLQGCIIDITEKKKQELWMQEHQHFLKKLVFDQSHSIRSKVANISGLLEIAEIEEDQEEIKRLIKVLKNEAKTLDSILQKSIRQSVEKNNSIKDQNLKTHPI